MTRVKKCYCWICLTSCNCPWWQTCYYIFRIFRLNMKKYLQQLKKIGLDLRLPLFKLSISKQLCGSTNLGGVGTRENTKRGEGSFCYCFLVLVKLSMSCDWRVLSFIPTSCSADSSLCTSVNTSNEHMEPCEVVTATGVLMCAFALVSLSWFFFFLLDL